MRYDGKTKKKVLKKFINLRKRYDAYAAAGAIIDNDRAFSNLIAEVLIYVEGGMQNLVG